MVSVNKVILVGIMTKDPEVTQLNSSVSIAKFTLAMNHIYKEKKEAFFADCEVWGKQAEIVEKYATKGGVVYVEGRLRNDTWEDKQTGQKKSRTKIVCDKIQLLRKGGNGEEQYEDYAEQERNPAQMPSQMPEQTPQYQSMQQQRASQHKYGREFSSYAPMSGMPDNEDDSDEIPF